MSEIGHNSNDGHLKSLIDRIERVEAEKRERAADVREIYAEGKSAGYDVRVMRRLVSMRRQEERKRREEEEILAIYMAEVGMI